MTLSTSGPRDCGPPRLVGVVHLSPLPGSARGPAADGMSCIVDRARRDATAYAAAGFDALIVENFGDAPFSRDAVGPHVIAAMAIVTAAVRAETGLPIGVNILRNDVLSAVAVAALTGAGFVRANVYVGAAVTDQGVIQGQADEVQQLMRRLGAAISVWADVDVKHAALLAPRPIGEMAEDAVERGLAEAVIVTGRSTGRPAAEADLIAVRQAVPGTSVYVGSGVNAENIASLLQWATGVIVGSAAKTDGIATSPVNQERATAIVAAARTASRPMDAARVATSAGSGGRGRVVGRGSVRECGAVGPERE